MNWSQLKQRPVAVLILQGICILISLNYFVMLYRTFYKPEYVTDHLGSFMRSNFMPALLWLTATVGILKIRKWGWALLHGFVFFSLLNLINLIATRQMGISLKFMTFLAIVGLFVWGLNLPSVRKSFELQTHADKMMPEALILFAAFCIAAGSFLIIDLYYGNRMISAVPVQVYITGMGLVFVILGVGVWKNNRFALLAMQSFLIFTLLSVLLIFGHGFFRKPETFKIWQAIFYLTSSLGLLLIWIFKIRPELSGKA